MIKVVGHKFTHKMPQVVFTEDHKMLQTLLSDRSHESLCVRVAVCALRGNAHAFDARFAQIFRPFLCEQDALASNVAVLCIIKAHQPTAIAAKRKRHALKGEAELTIVNGSLAAIVQP